MKTTKRIIATVCALLLVFSLTSALADDDASPTKFAAGDMTVNGVTYGSPMAVAKEKLGVPDRINIVSGEWVYEDLSAWQINTIVEWIYDGLILTFKDDKLVKAKITKIGYMGPHDVEVGMPARDVVKSFYVSPDSTSSTEFYWNEALGTFDPNKPEADCGYAVRGADGFTYFQYLASLHPRVVDVEASDSIRETQDIDSEDSYASFTVQLDSSGVVSLEWYTY